MESPKSTHTQGSQLESPPQDQHLLSGTPTPEPIPGQKCVAQSLQGYRKNKRPFWSNRKVLRAWPVVNHKAQWNTLTRPALTPTYPVPVRRLVPLFHAFFRPHLTVTPLRFPILHLHQVWRGTCILQ